MVTSYSHFQPTPIPFSLKHVATKAAIALFRAVRFMKRGLERGAARLAPVFRPIGHLAVRVFIMPIYRLVIFIKLKIQRFMVPTRGFALFLISNKYLFHVILGIAAISTVFLNLRAQQAYAQDIGKNSLLYALATNADEEIVQEQAPAQPSAETKYLASSLSAVPHIDFDYTEIDDTPVASISVPGSIGAPVAAETGTSGAPRTKTETYVVKDGDTLGSIAQQFSVNVGTILWNNNLTERQYIRPGDTLRIPPVSGIIVSIKKGDTIAKIASRYSGDKEEILAFNKISSDAVLAPGTDIVVPDGRPPETIQTVITTRAQATERAAASNARTGVAFAANLPKPADASTASTPAAKLLWPTTGHVITQYYGWKHTGVDIDGDFTSPLYAAYDGVVTTAGWNNGGYGLQVMIQHPNGMTTRYGHSSKLFVKVGDTVKRGQVIAMMGSTGRSTGSHLHFEVYVNGKRTNPLVYIK